MLQTTLIADNNYLIKKRLLDLRSLYLSFPLNGAFYNVKFILFAKKKLKFKSCNNLVPHWPSKKVFENIVNDRIEKVRKEGI